MYIMPLKQLVWRNSLLTRHIQGIGCRGWLLWGCSRIKLLQSVPQLSGIILGQALWTIQDITHVLICITQVLPLIG